MREHTNLSSVQLVRERLSGHEADLSGTASQSDILSLRSRLNARSSVFKLPDELLSIIFDLTRDAWNSSEPYPLLWISHQAVCCRFRRIMISSPRLWTFIYPAHVKFTEIMLQRSRAAPLYVFYRRYKHVGHSDRGQAFRGLTKTMEHLHRIRAMDVRLFAPLEAASFFSAFIEAKSSILRSLILDGDDELLVAWEPTLQLFLSRSALEIEELDIPWHKDSGLVTLRIPSLHHLYMRQMGLSDGPYLTHLLPLLGLLPCLETLHLSTLNHVPFTLPPSLPSLSLPRLTRLTLDNVNPVDLTAFFEITSLPGDICLRIHLADTANLELVGTLLVTLQTAKLLSSDNAEESGKPAALLAANMMLESSHHIARLVLQLWRHYRNTTENPSVYLFVAVDTVNHAEGQTGLDDFLENPVVRTIRKLTVQSHVTVNSPGPFYASLRHLTHLEDIFFEDSNVQNVADFLEGDLTTSVQDQLWPSLRTIRGPAFPYTSSRELPLVAAISRGLERRKAKGTPIQKLIFHRHLCTSACRRALGELRKVVSVDFGPSFHSRNNYIPRSALEPTEDLDLEDVKLHHESCALTSED